MAEYVDEASLLSASRKVRDSGYTKTDAFTPFPVHGIDEALGIKPTILPFLVLCAGLTGMTTALLMQWWMNGVDYKYIISGKPFGITPASIPVAFELTILFSAFTSFLGMFALNQLPKFSNPVFTNPKFDRATNDRFFLYVSSADKYYNRESVKDLLAATHPESLDEVMEDTTPATLPRPILLGAMLLVFAGLIPGAIILNMRAGFSNLPRLHVFFDMDFQPKKKSQQQTTVFADGRTMRPQVAGTIARGQLEEQDPFYLGFDPAKISATTGRSDLMLVSTAVQPPEGEPVPAEPAPTAPAEPAKPEGTPENQPTADQPPAEQPPAEGEMPAKEPAAPTETVPTETVPAETAPSQVPATPLEPAKPVEPAPAAVPAPAQAAAPASGTPALNLPWVEKLPIEATEAHMKLGKLKYETYCSACHGYAGFGDGLVHKRAESLLQPTWIPPTSLHADRVRTQPVGQIFHTITKGQGKMASYATSITPKERWAIVLYVKALQRSRNASIEDVPVEDRSKLEEAK
jgi:mono/diheme cytochrome c family protein